MIGRALARTCATVLAMTSYADAAPPEHANVDRVVVRYFAPETGGAARPRFITERIVAFEARLDAMAEDNRTIENGYPERYVRAAIERHVTEDILAALLADRGGDPPELARLTEDARAAWADRVGGARAFTDAMTAESVDDGEVIAMLRRQMRAAYYVDRTFMRLLHPSEEELREVFRTSLHPYRALPFEEAAKPLARWLLQERLRVAEATYLQSARTRIKIALIDSGHD